MGPPAKIFTLRAFTSYQCLGMYCWRIRALARRKTPASRALVPRVFTPWSRLAQAWPRKLEVEMVTTDSVDSSSGLTDLQWHYLLSGIADGKCTPFLGAGVNIPYLSTGSTIALSWLGEAEKKYPLRDEKDLAEVAQYAAIEVGTVLAPKGRIGERLKKERKEWLAKQETGLKKFVASNHPLAVMARLPFPIYMTTNYDDLM